MYYTYVMLISKGGEWYTGAASDLKARLREHEQGEVTSPRSANLRTRSLPGGCWNAERGSTRFRRPLRLIYYEACLDSADAYRRERYLKTGKGKRYLRQRLKTWRAQFCQDKLERH